MSWIVSVADSFVDAIVFTVCKQVLFIWFFVYSGLTFA